VKLSEKAGVFEIQAIFGTFRVPKIEKRDHALLLGIEMHEDFQDNFVHSHAFYPKIAHEVTSNIGALIKLVGQRQLSLLYCQAHKVWPWINNELSCLCVYEYRFAFKILKDLQTGRRFNRYRRESILGWYNGRM
jgi:hypothetical protein